MQIIQQQNAEKENSLRYTPAYFIIIINQGESFVHVVIAYTEINKPFHPILIPPTLLLLIIYYLQGLSGWLSGKALTFHQTGLGLNSHRCPVSGQTATLVARVATPVIPASETKPVDQGWGKNYGIAKG